MNRNGEDRQNYFAWGCFVLGCVMLIASSLPAPAQVAVAGWPVRPVDMPTGAKLAGRAIDLHITGPHQTAPLGIVVHEPGELAMWHEMVRWCTARANSRLWHQSEVTSLRSTSSLVNALGGWCP